MRYLLSSVIALGLVYVLHLALKQKQKPIYYLVIFLILIISTWFTHRVEANEYFSLEIPYVIPDANKEINFLSEFIPMVALTPDQHKLYSEKVAFHQANAERTFNDAKNRCWYLPDKTKRDAAKYCINAIACLLVPGSPAAKLIASLISTLKDVGIDMLDEWNYINNKLYWCKYHYEMVEFYLTVLEKS